MEEIMRDMVKLSLMFNMPFIKGNQIAYQWTDERARKLYERLEESLIQAMKQRDQPCDGRCLVDPDRNGEMICNGCLGKREEKRREDAR